jgi:hypothetical protein
MSLTRRLAVLVVAVVAVAAPSAPSTAFADAAGPTDFRTEIVSVEPDPSTIALSIEGGDSFVRIVVDRGTEVTVYGYDDEPYIRIDPDGTVFENLRSAATYLNDVRYGTADVPGDVDPEAEPDWQEVAEGGEWAWHDHRAHWMASEPPVNMVAGDSLPPSTIELSVDGVPVAVTVVTTLVADPSPWPTIAGAGLGAALAALAAWRGRSAVEAIAVSAMALAIGLAQFLSLPASTGPRPIWFLPPAVAVVSASLAWWWHRNRVLADVSVALSALQLVLWAWVRRSTFTRPVLPTDAPFWLDRAVSAGAASAALVLLGASVAGLAAALRQPPTASSIAASSAD